MKAKIKKMKLEQAGKRRVVTVTLEKKGKEYFFTAKATDVLDETRFESLLEFWAEKVIPERELEASLTDEVIEEKIVKILTPKVK